MSILTKNYQAYNLELYSQVLDVEKRAEVLMSGLLQATKTGHLIVGVPTAIVRGIFDALDVAGISLPDSVDGGALRAAIVVMTPDELDSVGGSAAVTERGRSYRYQLGKLVEEPARKWVGVSTCWHLQIKSPELRELRKSYGLPAKLEGDAEFSVVVACRKTGVLAANSKSKSESTTAANRQKFPDPSGTDSRGKLSRFPE